METLVERGCGLDESVDWAVAAAIIAELGVDMRVFQNVTLEQKAA
jgi:hypothetical protein